MPCSSLQVPFSSNNSSVSWLSFNALIILYIYLHTHLYIYIYISSASCHEMSGASVVKNLPACVGDWVWSLSQKDPLEEEMATHSSILTWRIPMDRETWWATVCGIAKSQTWRINWASTHTWEGYSDFPNSTFSDILNIEIPIWDLLPFHSRKHRYLWMKMCPAV